MVSMQKLVGSRLDILSIRAWSATKRGVKGDVWRGFPESPCGGKQIKHVIRKGERETRKEKKRNGKTNQGLVVSHTIFETSMEESRERNEKIER